MQFGTSYYPEITPEAAWADDLRNMRKMSLSLLRVGEFAWSAIEPLEETYQFEWLDRFLDLGHELGMRIILGTPTATPPPWLTTQYPQMLLQRRDGTRHHPGGRRNVDSDDEIFRHFAVQIARQLGRRYGQHPAVIGWQIDNELLGPEGEPPESHGPSTTFRFRQYLKKIHADLATLNRRWGTRFWSQEYSDWGEISTPLNSRTSIGHVLDYSRYFSDSQCEFLLLQHNALRAVIDPRQWIGHNSTAIFDRGFDHAAWAEAMDVAGWDAYFGAAGRPYPEVSTALAHDMFRSAKHRPFWVFECNALDAETMPAMFGEMHARGAAAAILWHWRGHRANAENGSDTLCDHAGRPDPRRVVMMQNLSKRVELKASHAATLQPKRVALLLCIDAARVALTPDPYMQGSLAQCISYFRALIETYRVLWRSGVAVDVVRPTQKLDSYDMLVLPSARLLSEKSCEDIRRFVADGGTLLGVAKTAHQDEWGAYYDSPGQPLAEVLGFTQSREIFLPISEPTLHVCAEGGHRWECLPHVERVQPLANAEILARFEGGPLNAAPAAVRCPFEKGMSYYASGLSPGLIRHLLKLAAQHIDLRTDEPLGDDAGRVGILPEHSGARWLFNYSEKPITTAGMKIDAGDFAIL